MNWKLLKIAGLAGLLPALSWSQSLTHTIRGKVFDADSRQPLVGAVVSVSTLQQHTVTDAEGQFRLPETLIGRYELMVTFLGYDTLVIPEVLLLSGKETVIEAAMRIKALNIGEVVVRSPRTELDWLTPLNASEITVEETSRFPATFFDPARLATSFPGTVGSNDQTNGISVRGNSPAAVAWYLEGLPVVNPNHTPNAGTFSDRVTPSSGGVNILSAQLLNTSYFHSGPFPANFGNALGGIMDMRLRKGNNEQAEHTAQVGLIGIDLASEGPFSADSRASYLANYRYSTVGLLSAMGLDLGDEFITFQDFSFNMAFPGKSGEMLTIFGMGGISKNEFESPEDTTLWEFQKDLSNIYFKSNMGALGLTYSHPTRNNGFWSLAVVGSALSNSRMAQIMDEAQQVIGEEQDENDQSILATHLYLHRRLSEKSFLETGIHLSYRTYSVLRQETGFADQKAEPSGLLLEPYFTWRQEWKSHWSLQAGLHLTYSGLDGSFFPEPRIAIEKQLKKNSSLNLSYGIISQLQIPQIYVHENEVQDNLEPTRSHQLVGGWTNRVDRNLSVTAAAFYQSIFNVPVSAQQKNSFSALNLLEGYSREKLINAGQGQNYGIEVGVRKYFERNHYFMGNATLYRARYAGSDKVWRNSQFDGGYVFNGIAGKEWHKSKKQGKLSVTKGISLRMVYSGGFRQTPINLQASTEDGRTVFMEDMAFESKLNDYFRTDCRVFLKRQKNNFYGILSLDIQNVTNAQNIAYLYFDKYQSKIIKKYQLGIIPILSYKIGF